MSSGRNLPRDDRKTVYDHSFEGVIRALLEDPEGFTIEGFEDYYSAQEQEMLTDIQEKLRQLRNDKEEVQQ